MLGLDPSGGRRSLDFDLNVVPFIDLLASCIAFLLITATWTHLARLETVHETQGTEGSASEEKPRVQVAITAAGYEVLVPAELEACVIPKQGEAYDIAALRGRLQQARERDVGLEIAAIAAEDGLGFSEVIRAMEGCVEEGLIHVALGRLAPERPALQPCGEG